MLRIHHIAPVLFLAVASLATAQDGEEVAVRALLAEGRYAEARQEARRAGEQAAGGAWEPAAAARMLSLLADTLLVCGDTTSPEAASAARAALDLARKAGSAEGEAAARRSLGRVLADRGELDEARSSLEAALAIRRRELPPGSPALIDSIQDAAEMALSRGDRPTASAALQELKAVSTSLTAQAARTLELEARLERDEGRYGAALPLAEQALLLRQDGAAPFVVDALNLVGELEWFESRFDISRNWHQEAVGLAASSLGESHPVYGTSLANLALAEFELGNVAEAQRLQRQALAVTQAARGEAHLETSERLQNLANFHLEEGDYPQAMDLYDRVRDRTTERFGMNSDQAANIFHNVGLLQSRMGDLNGARSTYEAALRIWERTRGPEHPYVARVLEGLTGVLIQRGDLEEADRQLQRVVAIRARQPRATDAAFPLARRALVQVRMGRLAEARRLAVPARALCIQMRGETRTEVAITLALMGEVELALGRAPDAARWFDAAARMYVDLFGADHPQGASVRARWAEALLLSGHPQRAQVEAAQAENLRQAHIVATVRYLSEPQALSFASRPPDGRDVLLSLAASPAATAPQTEAAFDAVFRSRALVLDEMASRRPAGGPTPTAEEVKMDAVQRRLARLTFRQSESPAADRMSELSSARLELEKLERETAAASGAAGSHRPATWPTLPALLRRLPRRTALVAYVRYGDRLRSEERYVAFVVNAGRAVRAVPLGPAEAIDKRVTTWRRVMDDTPRTAGQFAANEERARLEGQPLRRLVWDPLQAHLRGVESVFIVPDGQLSLVSFAALPAPSSGFLLEHGPVLHYLSSERDLLQPDPEGPAGPLLAVGGPDYDARSADQAATPAGSPVASVAPALLRSSSSRSCPAPDRLRFSFLPEAAREAHDVADLWKESGRSAVSLVGRGASEDALRRAAVGQGIIHLATHGFFDSGCSNKAGRLDRGEAANAQPDNPLLRSGLALAAANRRDSAPPEADDGLLTALEVAGLDLTRAQWVVLSACGTGLGPVQDGEGVLGLRRAFAVAGARTTIMSLWPVSDTHTRSWMVALYTARLAGSSTPDAVRAAQIQSLSDLRRDSGGAAPPSLWAAFVAVGDWR